MKNAPGPRFGAYTFVLFSVFIDSVGFGIVLPILPEFLVHLTGKTLTEVAPDSGLIMTTFAVAQFLFGPLLGNLSDKYGRRPILLLSMFGFGVNYLLMGFAPNVGWLILGRGLAGIAGATIGPANAYISDVTDTKGRARGFGLIGAAFGLGFIVGPAIGGFAGLFGVRVPFFVAAGLAFANSVLGLFVLRESLPQEKRRDFEWKRANPFGALKKISEHRGVITLIIAIFLLMTSYLVYPTTWPLFAEMRFNWSALMIAVNLSFVGLLMVIVQGFMITRIVNALGERRAAIFGLVSSTIGMILMLFAMEPWMVFALPAVTALRAVSSPALTAMASQKTPSDAQGELQGIIASANGLGAIISPMIFSYTFYFVTSGAYKEFYAGIPFLISGVLAFGSLLIVIFSKIGKTAD